MGAWDRIVLRIGLRIGLSSLVVVALVMGGCSVAGTDHGAVARPAVVGASLSAGAESALRGADGLTDATIDLAAALDAVVGGGGVGAFAPLADGGLFVAPIAALESQVEAARSRRATLVVAVDALFWCVYGPAADEAERLDRLERGLVALDRLPSPLLLGDLPDVRDGVAAALGWTSVPDAATAAAAQARIAAWAAERERVRIFPLSTLHRDVIEGDPAGREGRSGLMADGLHATAEGQLRLAVAVAEALRAADWLPEGATIRGESEARRRLAPREIAPVRDPRLEAAAAARRLETLSAARTELDRSRAALDASVGADPATREAAERGVLSAVDAVMAADLFTERGLLDLPLLLLRLPEGSAPALRAALSERAGAAVLLARSPTASPEQLATAIEWLVALDREPEAIPFAARLGRLAAAEARDRVAARAAAATRAADIIYTTARRTRPRLASALVVDAVAWAEAIRAKEREAAITRAAARERGFELKAPQEEGVAVLIGVLEATGRQEDAAAVRRAVP